MNKFFISKEKFLTHTSHFFPVSSDTQMVRILHQMATPMLILMAMEGPMVVVMEDLEVVLVLIAMAMVTELADALVMVDLEAIVVVTFFLLLLAQLLYEKNSFLKWILALQLKDRPEKLKNSIKLNKSQ